MIFVLFVDRMNLTHTRKGRLPDAAGMPFVSNQLSSSMAAKRITSVREIIIAHF